MFLQLEGDSPSGSCEIAVRARKRKTGRNPEEAQVNHRAESGPKFASGAI
jgi:hypothetical protein